MIVPDYATVWVHALLIALSGKTPETFCYERDVFKCPRGYLWAKGKDAWFCVTHSDPEHFEPYTLPPRLR